TVDVAATNFYGSSSTGSADQFTYNSPSYSYTGAKSAPTITGLSGSSGPQSGGSRITVTGTNFLADSSGLTVTFGGSTAIIEDIVSDTQLVVLAPSAKSTGTIDIQAAN